jgi:hypothetical protein
LTALPLTKDADDADEGSVELDTAVDAPDRHRSRRRTWLLLVLVTFAVTRVGAGYVADHPTFYGADRADATGDVYRYDDLTWYMRHTDLSVYGDLQMEYPPGVLPVILVPRYIRAFSYRTEFIAFMIMFDAVGLWGLARIGRRTGSWWGVLTWLLLVPALGPVAYDRFDMVVAVIVIWMLERALAGRWDHVGALIGAGAAVKLVPAALLPMMFFAAPRAQRRALVGWFSAVVTLCVAPFAFALGDLYRSAIQYHTERGVQAESIWGAGLIAAGRLFSYPVRVVGSHRAFDALSPSSAMWKTISNALSASVLLALSALGWRWRTRADDEAGDLRRVALLAFALMTLIVGLGRVYSPQYLLWIIGLGAGAAALAPRAARPALIVLGVTIVLAHIEFPFWFWDALFNGRGGALIVLLTRDVLTIVAGALALVAALRTPTVTRKAVL